MQQHPIMKFGYAIILCLGPLYANAEPAADRVLRNAAIYTVNANRDWAEAVAITKGRISFVGSDDDVEAYVGDNTEVIDLGGRMLMPGFHDSHMHPMAAGTRFLRCNLASLEWPAQIQAAVRICADKLEDGEWLHGVNLPDQLFDQDVLHRTLLDQLVPDHPVFITNYSGFDAWVNSRTLAAAGIDAETADPTRGQILRQSDGEASGVLKGGAATSLVRSKIPYPDEKKLRLALKMASEMANGFGITSANESQAWKYHVLAYRAADQAGEMTLRVQASLAWNSASGMEQLEVMKHQRQICAGQKFRAEAVKLFLDGDFEGHSANLLEPYEDTEADVGEAAFEVAQLNAIIAKLDAAGFQVHMHTVGDRAVRNGLDAIEYAIKTNGPSDRRHQLAHIALIDPVDLPRFAALGVVADFQPLWANADQLAEGIETLLGESRSSRLMAINSMFASGARVVAGSDWISSSMNPLVAIQIAITRRPLDGSGPAWLPAERVSLAQMIDAYTINGAWLARQEYETGSVEIGKVADLIVLEKNLFEVDPMQLHKVRVLLTLLEGETVFRGEIAF